MTPHNARERLDRALDLVLADLKAGRAPADVIGRLVQEHGASFKPGASTNTLRAAGVTATCTWSEGEGLLAAWRRLALARLMKLDGRSA